MSKYKAKIDVRKFYKDEIIFTSIEIDNLRREAILEGSNIKDVYNIYNKDLSFFKKRTGNKNK